MRHPNPFITAFLNVPEGLWKNKLRRWLGFSPFVPDVIQDFSPLKGYERVEQLREGDVVVDAGAYPGDYTLFAADKVGPHGRVFAIEPDPLNRAHLKKQITKSGMNNVTIVPTGLWSETTTLSLDSDGVASAVSSDGENERIPVTTLDALMSTWGLDQVDVLKMDIEGSELQALKGAGEFLKTCRYVCVASYHMVDGETTAGRVESILRLAGFEVETGYPKHLTTTGVVRT